MSKTIFNKCTFNFSMQAVQEHTCNCGKGAELKVEAPVIPLHPPLLSKEAQDAFRKDFF